MSEIFIGNKDRYISEKILGRGGMSEVFLVRSATEGRLFAAKRARKFEDNIRQRAALYQIKNETLVLKYLSGNNTRGVPQLIDRGDDFFVMKYIEGKTFGIGVMKFNEAVDVLLKLCDIFISFEDMEQRAVYLDLKPSNIMLLKSGEVYLIDFGCAKFIKRYEEISTKDEGKANEGKVNGGTKDESKANEGKVNGGTKDESKVNEGKANRGKESECKKDESKENAGKENGVKNFRAGTKSYAAPEQFGGDLSEDVRTDIFQFGQLINEISNKAKALKCEKTVLRDIALKCTRVKQSDRPMTFRDIRKELIKSKKKSRNLLAKSIIKISAILLSGCLTLLFAFLAIKELSAIKTGDLADFFNLFSEYFKGIKLTRTGKVDIKIITERFYGNLMSEAGKILYNNNRGLMFAALCVFLKKITGYLFRLFGRGLITDEKDKTIPDSGPYFIDIVKTCDSIE
ncbi:protein kinase domain-containing protein [Butyrivibrio sp. NC2002]|uniref:protein kinase domain-containing protein n=1 Tax=Butyrivibrio sp. NC2002 TaxID=1410610 RepID=UPI00055D4FDC|nr:hypothetical protein [Butyrivibrio sp. NC2002]